MSADETRIPRRSPTLQAILVSTFLLPLGVPLLSPVLPAIRDSFGITDARTSLLITAYFVPGIVLSPVIGMLADQVGRKRA